MTFNNSYPIIQDSKNTHGSSINKLSALYTWFMAALSGFGKFRMTSACGVPSTCQALYQMCTGDTKTNKITLPALKEFTV